MDVLWLIIIAFLAIAFVVLTILYADLRRKNHKTLRLLYVGKRIVSNIKFKPLMHEIMEIAKEETCAEACTLYIVDEERQELWFEVVLGEKGDKLKQMRLKIGEGIAGTVARDGITINSSDVSSDSRHSTQADEKTKFKTKCMLTVPVKIKDKTIGVLQVINKRGSRCFDKKDEDFLESMASQVAIALENAQLYKEMQQLFEDSIKSLANAIDAKDPYTNGHSQRVTEYSVEIGKELGFDDDALENLEYMAVLHDVGKIGISDNILNKQAQLDNDEFAIMKTHTLIGARILSGMKSLSRFTTGAKYHHEKYDGSGYFEKIAGKDIPFEARIISVADTYDAMTTDRPYRKGLSHEDAVSEINRCSGTQFDPEVVTCFNRVMAGKQDSNDQV